MKHYTGLTPLDLEKMTDDQIFLMAIDEDTIKGLFGSIVKISVADLQSKHGVKLLGYGPGGVGTGSWSKCQWIWWKHGEGKRKSKEAKSRAVNDKKRKRRQRIRDNIEDR